MNGRTPGGEVAWKPHIPAELREIKRRTDAVSLENSKRPHAICHHHGITKRDGTPKAFIEDERGGCNGCKVTDYDSHGIELCRPFWQSLAACPMGAGCLHGT